MKHLVIIGLCLWTLTSFSQTAQDLFGQEKYKEVILLADNEAQLTKHDLYFIGRSYFKLENDNKAIEFYDKAIQKGLNTAEVYFYKGLSCRWLGNRQEAIDSYNKALSLDPTNQVYMSERALAFYYDNNLDSAFYCAQEAIKLPYQIGISYYLVPHIQHLKQDFEAALNSFYDALEKIDPQDEYYPETLQDIGQLEYTITKNYDKAAQTYSKLISLNPKNFDLYPKLIKAYYGHENYSAGDSLFSIMKTAYENHELSKEYMEYGSAAIDEFEWNGQKVTTYKYFKAPEKSLDVLYKIYLLTPAEDKIERTILTEQTIQLSGGPKHLLCEKERDGTHHTYPYGWDTDDIDYADLKKATIMVLDGKIKPQASSNFGMGKKKKK